jgi:hypothetical protein
MSAVVVVTPLVIGAWPAIAAAVTAAVSSMGFAAVQGREERRRNPAGATTRAEIEVEDSEVFDEGLPQQIVVERDGVRATFTRDDRGALKLCMEGEHLSKSELRAVGEELLGRVTQQFVYHKLMTEMQHRHMNVVEEEVTEDRTIRIRLRGA